ncbi:hypothetical protein [Longimicrobium sp.]|uniref:hypothetical protein n=1 Tax=Longimicrobium sp. TaxID=2029185 RepID=UPI002E2FBECF|nr:hypothetical protein [Longimicrobium sp.]HEX6042334.1 hypothetical protein [Longimicrobium sp.]
MPSPSAIPRSVRTAAMLFALYGVMVLANALVLQTAGGWADAGEFPRALLRLFGCGAIAYGLMRGVRWAWWVGVVFAGFWSVMGAGALLVIARMGAWDTLPMPGFSAAFLVCSVLVVGAAFALLLQPASRDAFR